MLTLILRFPNAYLSNIHSVSNIELVAQALKTIIPHNFKIEI